MKHLDGRIPNLDIMTYGPEGAQIKLIEGTVKLDAWSGFQSRQGIYNSLDTKLISDGIVKLQLGGDMVVENPEVSDEHVNAYKYLVEHQFIIRDKILSFLMVEYPRLKQLYDLDSEEERMRMPNIDNKDQFKNLVGLSVVHLLNVCKDKIVYVGYEFGCTWDDEHGLGIMTHKDQIIKLGCADSAFLSWIAEKDL